MMKPMVVVGLGVTGRAVTEALLRRNHQVVALDDRIDNDMAVWADGLGLTIAAANRTNLDTALTKGAAVLPTPGLPDHHLVFETANRIGTEILSEFDLATSWDDRPAIAITGTDGKTTVVTLVAQMLERSGITVAAVGNTDTPYVEAIDDPTVEVFVVEASSFRLGHSRKFSPQVAAWLNFGPDHLDAHKDLSSYEAAKASIWAHLESGATAIANRDDPVVMAHLPDIAGVGVESFGAGPPEPNGHGVADSVLIVAGQPVLATADMPRSMPHDLMNALAASACALKMGASREALVDVLRSFTGLAHRVEFVAEIDAVRYINDSKATTPHAASAALSGFDSVVLLAGGRNKGLGFDPMVQHLDHITHVVLFGESADEIKAAFGSSVKSTLASSMESAVAVAAERAQPGDTVLLAPGCTSFDWYESYGERGDHFARVVRARVKNGASR